MNAGPYFHFTLGPVQGFVAQARRTRDFWAGSFLLSYLAAVAMQAVRQQGGTIVFPEPPADFMQSLITEGNDPGPRQGGVPNRFSASVQAGFEPGKVTHAVQAVWKALADHVWDSDQLSKLDSHGGAREIWDEQIAAFWDMAWVLTETEDYSALDRRKNWRSHYPPDQGGAKCMIMDGWREFSGAAMLPIEGHRKFWSELRASGGSGKKSDLEEGEALCAIAYVKRRFARHFSSFHSGDLGRWQVYGWNVPTAVPSVAYIAAAEWLAAVIKNADPEKVWKFHDATRRLIPDYGEWNSDLRCIRDALGSRGGTHQKWQALDGSLFFPATYDNENRFPGLSEEREKAKGLLKALREDSVPSPFYAVLAMDGDRLGALLAGGNQSKVSQALGEFTASVPCVVNRHSGFLIYAGGDDVLALLPLGFALTCATELRKAYLEACDKAGLTDGSISAAVHFAHFRSPLGRVLGDAHSLLDDIAKNQTGRDAIAVRVSKPGGVACTWSMPWQAALEGNPASLIIKRIADQFAADEQQTPFSSKYFYRIRELLQQFNVSDSPFSFEDKVDLMASRYLVSGVNQGRKPKLSLEDAAERTRPLLQLCRQTKRDAHGKIQTDDEVRVDAALLIRFLAAKGLGREDRA